MIRTAGIVLCGGQSKRMGKPKAWLPFGNELMLQRVVRLLREAVEPIVVVAAPDQEVPPLPPDIRVVRDEEEGRGPLQGLAAGLTVLHGLAEAAYLSSCDVPFLKPAFVRRMIDLLGENSVCIPRFEEHLQPLAAVYRMEVATTVRELLKQGRVGPYLLAETVPTRIVATAELADVDPTLQTLRNLNTPGDYEAALAEL